MLLATDTHKMQQSVPKLFELYCLQTQGSSAQAMQEADDDDDDDAEHEVAMPKLADDAHEVHRNARIIEVPMKAIAQYCYCPTRALIMP